jgi:hypothetical protein
MKPLTVADFIEAHADVIKIKDGKFTIAPSLQVLIRGIIITLLHESKSIVAGPSTSSPTIEGTHYKLASTASEKNLSIMLSPAGEPCKVIALTLGELLNVFAHCSISDSEEFHEEAVVA